MHPFHNTCSPSPQRTLNHQSHMKPSSSKTVPLGQRKVCGASTAPTPATPLTTAAAMQMWKDWHPASRSA